MNVTKLSWRDVFDSEKKRHGHIDVALGLAVQCGYSFFTWNGLVYDTEHVLPRGRLEDLGLT
jgi:hypothetical protein